MTENWGDWSWGLDPGHVTHERHRYGWRRSMSATGRSKRGVVVSGVPQAAPGTRDEKGPQRSKMAEAPVPSLPFPSPIFFLFLFPITLYYFIMDFASETLTSRIKWRSSYISSSIIVTHPPTTLVPQIHPASSWITRLTRNSPPLELAHF